MAPHPALRLASLAQGHPLPAHAGRGATQEVPLLPACGEKVREARRRGASLEERGRSSGNVAPLQRRREPWQSRPFSTVSSESVPPSLNAGLVNCSAVAKSRAAIMAFAAAY